MIAVLKAQPNKIASRALLLLTYTGARKSEVLGVTWDQFELGAGTWTKPHHTKQKELHHVPLNSDASGKQIEPGHLKWLAPAKPVLPGPVQNTASWTAVRAYSTNEGCLSASSTVTGGHAGNCNTVAR